MSKLQDKVVIVTGVASDLSLGRSIARLFAENGAKLVITDIDTAGLADRERELLAMGAEVLALEQNVVEEHRWQEVVDATLARFGRLDVLINNAGIAILSPLLDFTQQQYDRQIDVNMRSVFLGCQKAIPAMIEGGGGAIVNMSSICSLKGIPAASVYGMAKAAVQVLTKSVAIEHAKQGIRCNSLHPGVIDTNIQNVSRSDNAEAFEAINNMIPMGRMGTPEEVAECALFLASDASRYVTGTELVVDGGIIAS